MGRKKDSLEVVMAKFEENNARVHSLRYVMEILKVKLKKYEILDRKLKKRMEDPDRNIVLLQLTEEPAPKKKAESKKKTAEVIEIDEVVQKIKGKKNKKKNIMKWND
jgi:hypothetical protein